MARQPEDLPPLPSSLPFLVTLPAIFSCLPVDEYGGCDEGGDEEDDPRRLLLRRPRVRHVLEPVQRRLLFSEKEIERNSGFVGWSGKKSARLNGRRWPKKANSTTTEPPPLFLLQLK